MQEIYYMTLNWSLSSSTSTSKIDGNATTWSREAGRGGRCVCRREDHITSMVAHQACHHHQRATWAANNTTNYDYTQYIIMSCRVLEDIGLSGQRKLNPLKLSPRIRFGPNYSFAVSSGTRKFGYIITGKKNYIIPGHTHIHRRRECGRRSTADVEEEEIVCHEICHWMAEGKQS